MTTIAWDGKTLAGDKQTTHDGTPTPTRKVFRFMRRDDGQLVLCGCAGDTSDCQAYVRWARGITKKEPAFSDLLVMLIDRRGRVWCATEKMNWYRVGARQWAIGSGADYALAAMMCGKSAREAVRIASRLDTSTGLGVDVVTL